MLLINQPCCNCTIATDTLARAPTYLGDCRDLTGWTFLPGPGGSGSCAPCTCDLSSGLYWKSTCGWQANFNTPSPELSGDTTQQVRVQFAYDPKGDQANAADVRINVAMPSASMNMVTVGTHRGITVGVTLTPACATIWMIDYTPGASNSIQDAQTIDQIPLGAGVWHTLEVCWLPANYPAKSTIRAKLTLSDGRVYGTTAVWAFNAPAHEKYVGLEAQLPTSPNLANLYMRGFIFSYVASGGGPYAPPCRARCPDCNTPCLIESDDFNRVDSSTLGCKWTQTRGTTVISANTLSVNGNSLARCNVFAPQLKPTQQVTAQVKITSDGDAARMFLNMDSAGANGLFAEYKANNYPAPDQIGVGFGSTTSAAAVTYPVPRSYRGSWLNWLVCYNGALLNTLLKLSDGTVVGQAKTTTSPITNGIYAGLGSASGAAVLDNFLFSKGYSSSDPVDPCPLCSPVCPACPGKTPSFFRLSVAGPRWYSPFGGPYGFDGTYYLPAVGIVNGFCTWQLVVPTSYSVPCTGNSLTLTAILTASTLTVDICLGTGICDPTYCPCAIYSAPWSGDCLSIYNLALPMGSPNCGVAHNTDTITAAALT